MVNVLLVEDDLAIGMSLSRSLGELGHSVTHLSSGAPAIAAVTENVPDVVLLDLGLPDMDGSTLLIMIRSLSVVPIVVITARSREDEVVRLLNLGADDYLVKPFGAAQLDARIKAVLRRTDPGAGGTLRIGDLLVDPDRREVALSGRPVVLRRRDFDILMVLAEKAGRIVGRDDLVRIVWGVGVEDAESRLDVHLSAIRAALGESGKDQRYLQTVRGVGLRLAAPPAEP